MVSALDASGEPGGAGKVMGMGMDVDGCEAVATEGQIMRAAAAFLWLRRLEVNRTQHEAAALAGVNKTTFGRLERGERPVRQLGVVAGLANALDVSPYALLLRVAGTAGPPSPRKPRKSFVDELCGFGTSGTEAPKCLAQLLFSMRMRARKLAREAAEDAGVNPSTWGQTELGQSYPSIPVLVRMGYAVGGDVPFYRRHLLIVAMRDHVQREECARRGVSWDPGWWRQEKVRLAHDWPASARERNGARS
ncbi:helix-turn-helix domain-containing protein [Amycolatopsis rubida]|uniref:Helix-turn-helix domain-containing protein n=1 Tax=Amycolatopsis rubida TaxID=112413 RepID=A0A1I6A4J1_9PSEU|nr:helix-turn-helix transcriptional regulator [Amycolatopsis rubida]SFQ63570.1 Helix-turn-helix domain-containing protein [Amycolatopsis rubida]